METQRRKFVAMLAELVAALDRPDRFVTHAAALGDRHAGYGATSRSYETVGFSLLWAIEDTLGPRATDEISDAWRELYMLIAGVMQRGASRLGRTGRSTSLELVPGDAQGAARGT